MVAAETAATRVASTRRSEATTSARKRTDEIKNERRWVSGEPERYKPWLTVIILLWLPEPQSRRADGVRIVLSLSLTSNRGPARSDAH